VRRHQLQQHRYFLLLFPLFLLLSLHHCDGEILPYLNFVVDSDDPLDLLLYENLETKSFSLLGLPVVLVDSDVDVDSDVAVFVL
jgi:hypothetical protein